jgi:pyrimidine operon attenuation protein / uracil phosphoribosyltransferase
MKQNIVLTNSQINHIIKRIAYQIYETLIDEKKIIIAGIASNGYIFAEKVAVELNSISQLDTILCKVTIDKKKPQNTITTSLTKEEYSNSAIVLVDDVLNSGSTLIYGVKHFLDVPLTKFKTVVLIDRNHKKYPVKADFKGISLSTSLQEHVTVVFEENESYAYLK